MGINFKLVTLILMLGLTTLTSTVAANDWPQWRGPNRDGTVTSFDEPPSWPKSLTEQWKIDVGLGYSTPLLIENRVYTFTRQGENEVMKALNAGSGEVVWDTSYACPFNMNPATGPHGAGPKSTPVFANGRLFTLGISGIVSAFDAETGRLLWQNPAPEIEPLYHTAMSPLVVGDIIIVHVGGHNKGALTAFDVVTGEIQWDWTGDGPAYGSPMVFELEGIRQVVTFTQKHLVGISVTTGELLWQRPYTTPSTTTSQTPLLHDHTVIETGRGNGVTAFRVFRQGKEWITEDVWHTNEVSLHMSNGVAIDGVLFGLSHLNRGQYFALDLNTGRTLWLGKPRQAENAAIVRAGKTIFSLEDDAELVVIRSSRTGFEPVKRYTVATSETWAQPAISGNRVFVKDVSSLTLWTLD